MKQNITVEQLNELSKKQADKLLEWVNQKKYYREDSREYGGSNYDWTLPALNIGQMIEFLNENFKEEISMGQPNKQEWCFLSKKGKHSNNKELCDALWQVVKEVLNKL